MNYTNEENQIFPIIFLDVNVVLNNGKDNLGKFDAKSDEGIFLGYSLNSKTFRIYNKRTMIIEESIHVVFYETNPIRPRKEILDDIPNSLEDMHIHEKFTKAKKMEIIKTLNSKKIKQIWIFQRSGELQCIILLIIS